MVVANSTKRGNRVEKGLVMCYYGKRVNLDKKQFLDKRTYSIREVFFNYETVMSQIHFKVEYKCKREKYNMYSS